MVRTFRNALVLIAAFFGITLCSDLAFSQATKMPGPVPPKRLEEYSAYAALWRTDGNFRSTIRISNQLETREIDAELTIYMADGTSWDLPSVHLAKSGVTTVDINEALAGAPDAVRSHLSTYGSARLRYHYDWQGTVYATLSILDLVRSLDYTVPFVFPPDQGKGETFLTKELRALRDTAANGTRYEGLWFRDGHNGGGFLALSNTTDSAFSADVQLSGMRSNVDRKAVIQGHSTVLLDLRDMFGMDDTRVGGITITHSGKSGALQVIGGLEDLTKGYSATLTLMPIVAKTKTNAASVRQYASAGLMVNEQNSHLGFPAGVQFVPYVFFRNLAPQVRTIHVTGYYAEGNTTTETKSLTLPDVMLEPGQAQELDIRDAMKSRPQISDINLLFSYTGDYGDILAATGSTDGTGNYVFPVIPQAVGPSGTRTSIYWEVAGGFDTMYTVWNPTAIPQELVAIIHYGKSGEKFTLPLHLNEYASAMIDIGELIRTQQADQDQNVLPQDTHEGSLEVSAATQQPEDLITVALAEGIYNPTKATCGFGCETCSGVTTWGIDPGSFSIPMSQNSQGQFFYQMASGGQYYATSSSHWGSGNTSIASVQDMGQSNPGLATGVGAGSTTISATYIANLPVNAGQICTPLPLPLCPTQGGWTGQSPANVGPTISGSHTVWWFNGQDPASSTYPISVSLTSTAGTSTTWSVSQSDAKVTLSASTGNPITVTATGSHFSSQNDDITITASANGQSGPGFKMTAKTPWKLSSVAGSGTFCNPPNSYSTELHYNLVDNLSATMSTDVLWNESIGACNNENGSNWCNWRLQANGGSTNPVIDRLGPPDLSNNPSPTPNCTTPPSGATRYRSYPQTISAGNSDSGGVQVQSDVLGYYIDHGQHDSIQIPPAPAQ